MAFEPEQKPGSSAEIQQMVENQGCPEDIRDVKDYVETLKGGSAYYSARKLLGLARAKWPATGEDGVWIVQQLALCTYKDEELPTRKRLEDALALLEEIGLCSAENRDSETLGLGGAVYKRKWQQFGQLEDLHQALLFYRLAYERNPQQDMGYGGVNAAFILDLLADRAESIARRGGAKPEEAERLRGQAADLRKKMKEALPPQLAEWQAKLDDPSLDETGRKRLLEKLFWFRVTLAEVHFGLQEYDQAGEWLAKAGAGEAAGWKKQTLFEQFSRIARLQGAPLPAEGGDISSWHPAWRALASVLGEEQTRLALLAGYGRTGLALSGGGFRASFFHLGVMARLAEMDALRGVEVLSTVSGGSILGAHYYLEVQNWLQTHADAGIGKDDYIAIVRRVQENFLKGVETNIRMQTLADLRDNLQWLLCKNYSRSHRLGTLYEQELYARVADGHPQGQPRTMPGLLVRPVRSDGTPEAGFKPRAGNWLRRAKVPELVLNSTSLNSGHNWQFTARSMGEPPGLIEGDIDVNERYRRMYYEQIVAKPDDDESRKKQVAELQNYRMGYAVAASACVPGLFEPLTIEGLYEGRTVRLVDGGVHDNQGVAGLLDAGCTRILCSDACGQMGDVQNPSGDPVGALLRTSSILQDRVREAEYQDLRSRLDSRALEGLFFVHTKKELEAAPLDWIGCQDPKPAATPEKSRTSYGVDLQLQESIAGIRTDLDSFTEVEAYALMASGYRIAKREFELLQEQHEKDGKPGTWGGYDIAAPELDGWPFRPLEPLLGLPPGANARRDDLGLQLKAASKTLFKVWDLVPAYKYAAIVMGVLVLAGLLYLLAASWGATAFSMSWGMLVVTVLVLVLGFFVPALNWLMPKEEAQSVAFKFGAAVVGYLLARFHLHVVDPLFLARGRLKRLLGL